jgi:uncharacterized RDD family membrane protein YckC
VVAVLSAGALWLAPGAKRELFSTPLKGQLFGFVMVTLPISLYFACGEAGSSGATWGKRRLCLRVVDQQGHTLALIHSVTRTVLKFLPWELSHFVIWQFSFAGSKAPVALTVLLVLVWVLIGANVVSALASRERLTLYDRLSRTQVTWAPER